MLPIAKKRMISDISLTLKTARRRSGFIHRDVAHLMGIHKSNLPQLENGTRLPSIRQLCELSIIYNLPPSKLLGETLVDASADIAARLATLPKQTASNLLAQNRQASLNNLAERLEQVIHHGQ